MRERHRRESKSVIATDNNKNISLAITAETSTTLAGFESLISLKCLTYSYAKGDKDQIILLTNNDSTINSKLQGRASFTFANMFLKKDIWAKSKYCILPFYIRCFFYQ